MQIVQPDYWTRTREEARVAHRLARIRAYKEQYGDGGNAVDFRTHVRQTREHYNRKIEEIRDDPRLPERGRRRMIEEVNREYGTAMNEALRDSQEAYEQERKRLDLLANPAPDRSGRTADQVAVRRELREDMERRWRRDQQHVMADLREAAYRGDTMALEVLEDYALEYVEDPALRREFAETLAPIQASRRTPAQKAAHEQFEALLAEESGLMIGMQHQYRLAEGDRRNAVSGAPVVTRDEVEGRKEFGMMAGIGARDEQ